MLPLYEKICEQNLIVLMHTGFDIAFPRDRIVDPAKIINVVNRFPELKLITSHLGAWEDWHEVNNRMAGRPIYMDISYTLDQIDRQLAREIILKHPREYILFASDSPWAGQQETYEMFKGLELGEELERYILRDNALQLLQSV